MLRCLARAGSAAAVLGFSGRADGLRLGADSESELHSGRSRSHTEPSVGQAAGSVAGAVAGPAQGIISEAAVQAWQDAADAAALARSSAKHASELAEDASEYREKVKEEERITEARIAEKEQELNEEDKGATLERQQQDKIADVKGKARKLQDRAVVTQRKASEELKTAASTLQSAINAAKAKEGDDIQKSTKDAEKASKRLDAEQNVRLLADKQVVQKAAAFISAAVNEKANRDAAASAAVARLNQQATAANEELVLAHKQAVSAEAAERTAEEKQRDALEAVKQAEKSVKELSESKTSMRQKSEVAQAAAIHSQIADRQVAEAQMMAVTRAATAEASAQNMEKQAAQDAFRWQATEQLSEEAAARTLQQEEDDIRKVQAADMKALKDAAAEVRAKRAVEAAAAKEAAERTKEAARAVLEANAKRAKAEAALEAEKEQDAMGHVVTLQTEADRMKALTSAARQFAKVIRERTAGELAAQSQRQQADQKQSEAQTAVLAKIRQVGDATSSSIDAACTDKKSPTEKQLDNCEIARKDEELALAEATVAVHKADVARALATEGLEQAIACTKQHAAAEANSLR
eukprot:TRINITY_DN40030_c0_g1_i2.p1 TRINITY_DN40030_c0_g1~~TRINITY_DN40030_c0_g1_i2.p1  ORF type:complete len:581 (-),score=206.38 TRINITY_DN40030_c0_g1_i2:718-2460(-)